MSGSLAGIVDPVTACYGQIMSTSRQPRQLTPEIITLRDWGWAGLMWSGLGCGVLGWAGMARAVLGCGDLGCANEKEATAE